MAEKDSQGESLRLTRSATIFNALLRMYGSGELPSPLVLHIVGADHREGGTPGEARLAFKDLHEWLCDEGVRTLSMLFCGPNIAPGLHGARYTFCHKPCTLRIATQSSSSGCDYGDSVGAATAVYQRQSPRSKCVDGYDCDDSTSLTVTLQFDQGLYHDVVDSFSAPDAMFLFNAGLWGYDDWLPTMEHILRPVEASPGQRGLSLACTSKLAIIVVTSYCAEEAEDDMDTLGKLLVHGGAPGRSGPLSDAADTEDGTCLPHDVSASPSTSLVKSVDGVEWLWGPEVNPHRSLVPRSTACGEEGRLLFENHSWQAIRPPKLENSKHNASIS